MTQADTPRADLIAEIKSLRAENERLKNDCLILLANIDWLQECTGEGLEGEDAVAVQQIRAALPEPPGGAR